MNVPDTNSDQGQCSVASSLTSSPATIRTSSSFVSSIRPPCPQKLQRTHSDVAPTVPYFQATGPPDLSAADLSDDEIRRTYSTNDLWDIKQQKLAPMLPCSGIGKFRMSTNAEPEFKLEQLRKSCGSLPPGMIDLIPVSDVYRSIGPEVWQQFRSEQVSRHNSFVSSRSSASIEFIEPDTGTRVTRGFTPSLPSSVRSSPSRRFQDGRGNSASSELSPIAGRDIGHSLYSARHHSNRGSDVNILSPLSTIREIQKQHEHPVKKREVPCDFSSTGDPDSAFVSESEDSSWDEVSESTTQARRSSELSRLMQARKVTPHNPKPFPARPPLNRAKTDLEQQVSTKGTSRAAFDRNRTIRLSRPQFRRAHVKGPLNGTTKHVDTAKDHEKQNLPTQTRSGQAPRTVQEFAVVTQGSPGSAESSTDVDDSPGDLNLWMIDVTEINNKPSAAHVEHTNLPVVEDMNDDQSDRRIRRRQRSGTAFRTNEMSETTIEEELI